MIRDMCRNELKFNLYWCEAPLFGSQIKEPMACIMSHVWKARARLFARIQGKQMSLGSLVCLLTVIYYCISLCSAMSCDAHCLPAKSRCRQESNH